MEMDESSTLSPLPPVVHSGSIVITIFGLTSFFSALALLIYLTYQLVKWYLGGESGKRQSKRAPGYMFASGSVKFGPAHDAAKLAGADPTVDVISLAPSERVQRSRYPNQFIVLIINLLIADLHQATAFALSLNWLVGDSITIGTGACFAQGLFVSCWIHEDYGNVRLLTHYIFIFISIFLSWVLYTAVFLSLRRQHRRGDLVNAKNTGYHHPAFLIYPVIYLICILPLAVGRVATMAGREPPLAYFCFAGALVASNGWLDVLLFTTTRRSIVFAHGEDLGNEDTGIDTFTFMNSAPTRTFGNTIWVRGGREERKAPSGGWWRILGDTEPPARKPSRSGKSLSQTSLTPMERNAIQMEVITTVMVEDDRDQNPHRKIESDSTSTESMKNEPYT